MSQAISKEQIALNAALHNNDPKYGSTAFAGGLMANLPLALKRMHEQGACNSFLDYGTGKGSLVEALSQKLSTEISIQGYDPAVKKYARLPSQISDIVTCLDVLEHIELESIDATLSQIKALTGNFCFLIIDLQPAVKKLSDGRNAHIMLAPSDWWITRISQFFPCLATFPVMHENGPIQKLIVAASYKPSKLPLMYSFMNKINMYSLKCAGGILGNKAKS